MGIESSQAAEDWLHRLIRLRRADPGRFHEVYRMNRDIGLDMAEVAPGGQGAGLLASKMQVLPSRKWIHPLNLQPEDIHIEDIALSLSNQCRWTGHVYEVYTVAEHAELVSHLCDPEDSLWGLLHDSGECYLNDFGRPVKEDPRFGSVYYDFERRAMRVICQVFGLDPEMPASVKRADDEALEIERVWRDTGEFRVEALGEVRPHPMGHAEARAAFLARFKALTEG